MKSLTQINNQLGDYVRFNEYVKYKLEGKTTYTARKREMNRHLIYFTEFVEIKTHKGLLAMNQVDINKEFDDYIEMKEMNKDPIKVRNRKLKKIVEKTKLKRTI